MLLLFTICEKFSSNNYKIFKEKISIETLKILCFINNIKVVFIVEKCHEVIMLCVIVRKVNLFKSKYQKE